MLFTITLVFQLPKLPFKDKSPVFVLLEEKVALPESFTHVFPRKGTCDFRWELRTWAKRCRSTGAKIRNKEKAMATALKSLDTRHLLPAQKYYQQVLVLSKTTKAAEGLKWWENRNSSFTETGNHHPEWDRVPQLSVQPRELSEGTIWHQDKSWGSFIGTFYEQLFN